MSDPLVVWFLVLGDVGLGLAVGWTTWAAATGRLRVNGLAGIRTRATMASDAAWVAGHRAAWPSARALAVLCVGCVVGALILLPAGLVGAAVVVAALPVVAVLIAAVPMTQLASRAARAADG